MIIRGESYFGISNKKTDFLENNAFFKKISLFFISQNGEKRQMLDKKEITIKLIKVK